MHCIGTWGCRYALYLHMGMYIRIVFAHGYVDTTLRLTRAFLRLTIMCVGKVTKCYYILFHRMFALPQARQS